MLIKKVNPAWQPYAVSPLVEAGTVAVLFLLALVLARPQLEGWGVQRIFQALGPVQGYISFLKGAPTRLFEPLPLGAAWFVSHGAPWGVGLVYGVIIVGKYFAGRWAGGAAMPPALRWLSGVAAAVMLPWIEQWRGHNMAQQLAALLVVLSFGAALRSARAPRRLFQVMLFTGVLLALLTYEGIVVCCLAMPLFVKLADLHEGRWATPSLRRVVPPVLLALVLYVAYFLTLRIVIPSGYQGILMAAESPFRHPARLLFDLYATAYLQAAWTLASVGLLVGVLCYFVYRTPDEAQKIPPASPWLIGCVALLLPLLGLCYAINFYFLMDVERIGLPVGVGLFMLTISSLGNVHIWNVRRSDLVIASVTVAALLAGESANAYITNLPFKLQDRLLRQLSQTMNADPAKRPVLLRDWTGKFGDLYTFFVSGALQDALAVTGNRTDVELCTADGVDRRWLKFWSVNSGGGLQRCSLVDPPAVDRLVLDYKPDPNDADAPPRMTAFSIERAPDFGKIVSKIIEGSFSGREGRLIWVNQAHAVISLVNKTSDDHNVIWQGSFTPAPCPSAAKLRITVDGIVASIAVPALTPYLIHTTLGAGQTKTIMIDMDSESCKLDGDKRAFYVGIVDMTTLIQ